MSVIPLKPKTEDRSAAEEKLAGIYKPANQREMKALVKHHEKRAKAKPVPAIKVEHAENSNRITVNHSDGATGFTLMMDALGTTDADFASGIVAQMANLAPQTDTPREADVNFARALVTGMEPRDQVEAMLATQMAAVHMATITYARRVNQAENLMVLESHEKAMNRLARTFAAQVEALKRYRSKGEQRVYVERVDVRDGGQAVVGNVTHRGGGQDENGR